METCVNSDPNPRLTRAGLRGASAAFSLVEVALALAIMAFSLVAVLGLMPAGMTNFRKAMDLSVGAQIAQHVMNDAQQSDFDVMLTQGTPGSGIATSVFDKPARYFDDQGEEGVAGQVGMTYKVRTLVIPSTSLPGTPGGNSATGIENKDIATIIVQVAGNLGRNLPSPLTSSSGAQLWPNTRPGTPVATYSTYVARSSASSTTNS